MKVVGIGGGHGLAQSLRAVRRYASDVSAVVTVADDGGSSGRLTHELGIPPPGDIRNCLVALSEEGPLTRLFQHRFSAGALEGHALGNLVIAALAEERGSFAAGVQEAGRLLGAGGRVFPATEELVRLGARVSDGEVSGQVAVARTSAPIESLHLEPRDPRAHPDAVRAIEVADQVVLGPGSLFTSVIAALLVPGIAQAVRATSATRIFVCNARRQAGEAERMTLEDHVRALVEHLGPASIDVVVVQSPPVDPGLRLGPPGAIFDGMKVVEADLTTGEGHHDPERLATTLRGL